MAQLQSGYLDGKHYGNYGPELDRLRREERLDEAETLLLRLLDVIEGHFSDRSDGVPSDYYNRLAVIYRKQKRPDAEIALLERFARQRQRDTQEASKLLARLAELKGLQAAPSANARPSESRLSSKEAVAVLQPVSLPLPEGVRLACVVDVETTGLDRAKDEIVELGMLQFAFNPTTGEVLGIVEEYSALREPNVPISRGASAVHGLRLQDVKGHRLNDSTVNRLIDQSDFLVAHNATFDRAFVSRLFHGADSKPWYCSMNGINWAGHGYTSKGLQNLLTAHKILLGQAHRGKADALGTLALLACRAKYGQTYFSELLSHARLQRDVVQVSYRVQDRVSNNAPLRWGDDDSSARVPAHARSGCVGSVLTALIITTVSLLATLL